MNQTLSNGPMLNAYPDSIGGTLSDAVALLRSPRLSGVFSSFYILPSLFNTDLDRGFSVIDYRLNELLARQEDLDALRGLGVDLKLDFILNHASVLSPQFQDILKNGTASRYADFFIDWNRFWEGAGTMTEEGYIQPDPEKIRNMFFRKAGLPILMVRMPDGRDIPYWNTFYQEVRYPLLDPQDLMDLTDGRYGIAEKLAAAANRATAAGRLPEVSDLGSLASWLDPLRNLLESRRRYLGQMDLNIRSPLVWEFYADTLRRLRDYGARIVRLDAFAYAPKEAGSRNFMNDPGTWDLLARVRELADPLSLALLPEIHASYEEGVYRTIGEKGYMVYDFFLPGLILDALEEKNGETLAAWAREIIRRGFRTLNMLGCHDGIPLLDLKGLLPEERIQKLIDTVVARGGMIKNLHGAKNVYYQVNATYYSALGEDDRKMLLARALQLFMPGKPQVWYLDLFAGRNDLEAVRRAGPGGHKEINRTNLPLAECEARLAEPLGRAQLALLRLRNTSAAFAPDAEKEVACSGSALTLTWRAGGEEAVLEADLADCSFTARVADTASGQEKARVSSGCLQSGVPFSG